MLPDWPRVLGPTTATASLRSCPADFFVAEDLGFEPSGDGEHDFLFVEKTGQTTSGVASRLATLAGVRARDVGFSGMKDRHAVTRQWFSVPRSAAQPVDWDLLKEDGLRLLQASRHRRKLKRGSHKRNQFRLVLRDLKASPEEITDRLQALSGGGMPNYFGEQRFGRGGSNLAQATRLFAGRRLPRLQRSMALSAARALIFNNVLAARVLDGSWDSLQAGDVAGLDGSGSVFAVTTPDDELASRVSALDVHPTGPLWGSGRAVSSGAVAEMEQRIAEESGFSAALETHTKAQRRPLRCRIDALEWEQAAQSLTLEFSLGKGSFATVLVRELVVY